MMNSAITKRRRGISLMEVLISIGVISLGIFGVASLIPVAQFKVAEGTTNDRVASLGPSAAAQFRIHGMNDANNWTFDGTPSHFLWNPSNLPEQQQDSVKQQFGTQDRKAFCIDPLWLAEAGYSQAAPADAPRRLLPYFPASSGLQNGMIRLGLRNLRSGDPSKRPLEAAVARKIFQLADEVVFDRPSDQSQNARRQYFRNSSADATTAVTNGSMSWFATLSPSDYGPSDEYVLSIVVVKDRVPLLGFSGDSAITVAARGEERVSLGGSEQTGEIWVENWNAPNEQDLKLGDLGTGDWVLLSRLTNPAQILNPTLDPLKRTFRWTQIIGSSDETLVEVPTGNPGRYFTVANDDFWRPGEVDGRAIVVRGVKAVFERTIRVEKRR